MANLVLSRFNKRISESKLLKAFVVIIIAILIFLTIILPISLRPAPSLLKIGDVAFQDINSPRTFSFTSDYLTNLAKDEAEKTVSPVYLPADPAISRKQIETLKTILSFITITRNDPYAKLDQKIADIQAIKNIVISEDIARELATIPDERWEIIQSESLHLLEQVMRSTIREDQVVKVQRNLSPLISFDFSEQETKVISELVTQMIVANSLYSNEITAEAIAAARDAVVPVVKSYAAGEIIVNSGEVIDPLKWEALQALGYTEPINKIYDYLSAGLLVIVMVVMVILYFWRLKQTKGQSIQGLPIVIFIFFIFMIAARFIIPNHTILPYLFPVAAFGLTISSVYGYETGLIGTLLLSILSAYDQNNSVDLALYYFIPSTIAIFVLGRGRRINIFFIAGLALSLRGSAIVLSYRILNAFLDITGASTLIGASFANGVLSISLALLFQYLLSLLLGKTTALQLLDLSRPANPLLQNLLTNAPGTYQHSLQVANLAEQAARQVKGDALLTRVGALYHDIGKINNPGFFIENQQFGEIDTHEDMDPVLAAATIIQHVTDGIKLAKKYHLPPRIQAFILEHHGTTITRYQFRQAVMDAGSEDDIERSLFRYPGPIPQSKETALLMLADGCEARMRSELPKTIDDISKIVEDSVNYYQEEGQLNDADLTFKDLQVIIRSFTRTFRNSYHHRMKYPNEDLK
ncbi:MAG: HDIG domain-containing protein [Caldisericaceae bacterium]|nr:HDIG domain-containing protein [Caldisericaceae bacterium]